MLLVDVGEHHVHAFADETTRNRESDAAGSAGDDSNLAFEVFQRVDPFSLAAFDQERASVGVRLRQTLMAPPATSVVNPSGGLISEGHPLGATGLAQCAELTWQLRGQAGDRQVTAAKTALQHDLGLGGAAVVGIYRAPST